MASFLFARFPDGRLVRADHLDPGARNDYRDLTCIGCGARMIPALGTVLRWHFRHDEGEGCAEYFAALAEGLILQSLEAARLNGHPYPLKVRNLAPVDLGKTREVLRGVEADGRRVDIALVGDRNRINIVIARRRDDLQIAHGASGLWLTIDATGEDEDEVASLADGIIVTTGSFIRTLNFPDQLRQEEEARRRAEETRKREEARADAVRRAAEAALLAKMRPGARFSWNRQVKTSPVWGKAAAAAPGRPMRPVPVEDDDLIDDESQPLASPGPPPRRTPVEDPDVRLPGETLQDHKARLMAKYPWMRRRP